MIKISRPILFTIAAGVIGYAVVLNTEPETAPHKKKTIAKPAAQVDADGFTKEDYNAHFARYTERHRDPFTPLIMPHKTPTGTEAPAKANGNQGINLTGSPGTWVLTGISALDGMRSALIENSSTHEDVFLTAGERWHGYYVSAVEDRAVVLTPSQGKEVRLAFVETAPTTETPGSAGAPLAGAPATAPIPTNNAATNNALPTFAPGTQRGR